MLQRLGFYDSDWEELDDDTKFVKDNEHDWKDSAVLHVRNCKKLEVFKMKFALLGHSYGQSSTTVDFGSGFPQWWEFSNFFNVQFIG